MRTMTGVLIAIAAASCGSSAPPANSMPAAPAAVTASEVTGTVPRNALVTLIASEPSPLPAAPAVMDQYAKQFVPNTLYVRVGQPVEFRNSEDMPHNVTVIRRGSGVQLF